MNKKNIGSKLALYPTPAVVVGTEVEGKATWTLVAHIGIVTHDRLLISLHSSHFINKGIKATSQLSVNIITEDFLPEADYCGLVSGAKVDKSQVFEYTKGEAGMPVISKSQLAMECHVEDIYECGSFENFICSIDNTYADEAILDEKGKLDYTKLKPVLFEMPTYQYLRTGDVIAPCTSLGKTIKEKNKS